MKTVIVHHDGLKTLPVGVNGKIKTIAIGERVDLTDEQVETVRNAGYEVEEVGAQSSGVDLAILDGSTAEIKEAIEGLPLDALNELLEAEEDGNTRKGVVKVLTAAIEAEG